MHHIKKMQECENENKSEHLLLDNVLLPPPVGRHALPLRAHPRALDRDVRPHRRLEPDALKRRGERAACRRDLNHLSDKKGS